MRYPAFARCLLLFLLSSPILSSESTGQYIPDPGMRAWLNEIAMGCVDANGILDPMHPELTQIEDAFLEVYWGDLTGIQYLTNLRSLSVVCQYSPVYLPAFPDSLKDLWMVNIPYTTLPPLPPALDKLYMESAYDFYGFQYPFPETLDTLTLTGFTAMPYIQGFNEGLRSLRIHIAAITGMGALPSTLTELWVVADSLDCLPILPEGLQTFLGSLPSVSCLPNMPLNCSYSTGVPSTVCTTLDPCPVAYGAVTGRIHVDWNGNGLMDDPQSEVPLGHVTSIPSGNVAGFDGEGKYYVSVEAGTYQVIPSVALPHLDQVLPPSYSGNISMYEIDSLNDFLVTIQPGISDLQMEMFVGLTRPGFDTPCTFIARNVGSLSASGSLQFAFAPLHGPTTSSPVADVVEDATLIWEFNGLEPGHAMTWSCSLATPASTVLGTPVLYDAILITAENDATPQDNTRNIHSVVTGSLDPNDKRVNPGVLTPADVSNGTPLTYTIRFQNTGTSYAERVLITDTLPAGLDPQSFVLTMSSHDPEWNITNGVLHFVHENIMLPDSTTDPEGSQGYVQFRIAPAPGLLQGDEVHNVANIYFDFNEPVITEPSIWSVNEPLGIAQYHPERLEIAPNPVRHLLRVSEQGPWQRFVILDGVGRTAAVLRTDEHGYLDVKLLSPGIYTLVGFPARGPVRSTVFIRE